MLQARLLSGFRLPVRWVRAVRSVALLLFLSSWCDKSTLLRWVFVSPASSLARVFVSKNLFTVKHCDANAFSLGGLEFAIFIFLTCSCGAQMPPSKVPPGKCSFPIFQPTLLALLTGDWCTIMMALSVQSLGCCMYWAVVGTFPKLVLVWEAWLWGGVVAAVVCQVTTARRVWQRVL